MVHNVAIAIKIFLPSVVAFMSGILITPFFSDLFYKYKLWKRSSRSSSENHTKGDLEMNQEFVQIHNAQDEIKTPRVGGIIVWVSVIFALAGSIALSHFSVGYIPEGYLNFLSRNQTLIPFLCLILGALLGLADDLLQIFGGQYQLTVGIPRRVRILLVSILGLLVGSWFYYKLGHESLALPFQLGDIHLGIFFIPFVIVVVLALFSSSVIDGIDGLAGGVMASIFGSYGVIGILQGQFDIAAFSFAVMGALLAFLWFNIPPARFYLGETGILALTLSLAVLIFLTDTVFEFLVLGFPLVITAFSSLAQIISRRLFHKKIFKVAPLHHHLEAIGWSREKITMRYWVFSVICSASGIIFVLVG